MDKPKTKLVKSKSSNSAITTKSEPRKNNSHKKSRSNAEFQPLILKKRGVYVEKKPTKISINEQDINSVGLPQRRPFLQKGENPRNVDNCVCDKQGSIGLRTCSRGLRSVSACQQPSMPHPIPRPSRKRFLASVLTILSQSTTGTQYPDHDDTDRLRRLERSKSKLRRKREDDAIQADSNLTPVSSKRRQRYRSKVLHDNDSELEQLVVLQTTRQITHTPSNISEKSNINYKDSISAHREHETIKWADILTPLSKNAATENIAAPGSKDNLEKKREKRVRLIDRDPSTLVAEVPKKEEKKLYNFFRDLLETTFSVYNVKTEFNQQNASSVNSSKVALEMDESVAKKLNIQKPTDSSNEVTRKASSSKYFYCIKPDPNEVWDDKQFVDHFQLRSVSSKRSKIASPTQSQKRRRRLQSESFDYKKRNFVPLTASASIPNKKIQLKKDRKKHFINLLKEQLRMEDDAFDEPQNFFQALKVIARNKRRCQKSIHFCEAKRPSEGDVHVCQFRRRKLFSASAKYASKKPSYHPESDVIRSMRSLSRKSDISYNSSKRPTRITITETREPEIEPYSDHSLEVFGFDYEMNKPSKKVNLDKSFPVSFRSSAATIEKDFSINDTLLKFCDSDNSFIMASHSHVADRHGLRSLSELIE